VRRLSPTFDKRKATSPGGDSEISPLTFAFGVADISHRASDLAFPPRDRKGASSNERRRDIRRICTGTIPAAYLEREEPAHIEASTHETCRGVINPKTDSIRQSIFTGFE